LRAHEEHQAHLRQQVERQMARAAAAECQQEQQERQRLEQQQRRQQQREEQRRSRQQARQQQQQGAQQQDQDPAAAAAAALAQPPPPLPPLEDQEKQQQQQQQQQQQSPLDVVGQQEADAQCAEQRQVQLELALKAQRTTPGNILAAGRHGRMSRAMAAPWTQAMRLRALKRLGDAAVTKAQLDAACMDVLASPLLERYMRPPARGWAPCEPQQLPTAIWYGLRLALVGRGWSPPEDEDDYGEGGAVSDSGN
jgi:hypothetical protein